MPVPNIFANATATIPLSQLDANFATAITLGNTAIQLGNSVSTLNNMTLANVTISTGNVTVADVSVSNSAVISVNTSGDALRITQTGAGNALLVEDSANPDSTPFVVDASGRLLIGQTSVTGNAGIQITSDGTSAPNSNIVSVRRSTDATGTAYLAQKSRGTLASPTIVASGDTLGDFQTYGYDGANMILSTLIRSEVDGTPGTNDMPGRLVFSTTADGASSPTERMRIDSAGRVGIGASPTTGNTLYIGKNVTGSVSAGNIVVVGTFQSDVTTNGKGVATFISTQASAFTLTNLIHFEAQQGTIGSTSAVTNQYGFYAFSSLTGATNNYGFFSNIASGTGRFNFYANGTADNVFIGSLGIGSAPTAGITLDIQKAQTGAATATTVAARINPDSTVTTAGYGFSSFSINGVGASTPNIYHYSASQGTYSGTPPTSQYGFLAATTLTGATNNFGFYSNIASGTGRWNFYANGTAENYLGGNLKIGGTAARATTAGTNQLVLFDGTAPVGTLANGVSFYSASGEARVMDAAGNSTLLSPHDSATNEWIFHSKHTPTGKVLRIDVEKMLRFINDHFGLDMIQEFTEE